MADFMRDGHFERHIRRMRAIYQSRRRLFVELLERECAGLVEVDAPDSGMNLLAWLPTWMSEARATEALRAADLEVLPLSSCTIRRRLRPGLVLGFSGIREAELREGVVRLRRVLEQVARQSTRR
jgi:GntR family transcriptional regulator/MocR family aminotransferase